MKRKNTKKDIAIKGLMMAAILSLPLTVTGLGIWGIVWAATKIFLGDTYIMFISLTAFIAIPALVLTAAKLGEAYTWYDKKMDAKDALLIKKAESPLSTPSPSEFKDKDSPQPSAPKTPEMAPVLPVGTVSIKFGGPPTRC